MADETKKSKKPVAILAVLLLLLCGIVVAWWVLRSRRAAETPKAPNMAPTAALRLDSIDQTNRVATLSDGGSRDPDGTLRSWRIAWGDGQEENLSAAPQKAAHTYAAEGEYTVSLLCVDNLGATSSPPAMTNITFDLVKRQKALELAKAEEAKREAERLKAEEARKEAERLEQERQKQMAAAEEARKAKEQRELEEKRKAEAELARQKTTEAAPPPPAPLAAALPDDPSTLVVSYTPPGCKLGEFQIFNEKTEGTGNDGNLLMLLVTRCVNFPKTPIPTSDWQIDGKDVQIQSGRIRASLSPGRHEVSAHITPKAAPPTELKADVMAQTTGDCVVTPRK